MTGKLPTFGLRGRLALSIALIMFAALAITYVAVYRGTGNDLRDRTDADLQRQADGLTDNLQSAPPGTPDEHLRRAERLIYSQPFGANSQLIAVSVNGAGTATNQPELFGQRPAVGPQAKLGKLEGEHKSDEHEGDDDHVSAQELRTTPEGFSTVEVEGVGDLRLLTEPIILPNGVSSTVRVGQPLGPVDEALEGLNDTFLVVGLITLLLAAAAGWLLASRATRPMRRMAGVAESVGGGELSARMPIDATRNDEVRLLARSFNGMLDRLEDAFNRQRDFVADASHDLRTPLTIIKGQLEVLSRDPDPGADDVRRVTAQVDLATGRMDRLINDLLLLAAAESGSDLKTEPSELEPLLVAEIEAFRETSDRSFAIGEITDSMVAIDRDQMSRVISNLIANAVAHTDPGGRVAVSANETHEAIVVAIDDDGPGVPPEMRKTIFDRFRRLDQSRGSEIGGSGLGLAIVKAIVEAHGGTVNCSTSPLGGARFSISLPGQTSPEGPSI